MNQIEKKDKRLVIKIDEVTGDEPVLLDIAKMMQGVTELIRRKAKSNTTIPEQERPVSDNKPTNK